MPLPPGLNQKDFADALRQFEQALGREWVFSSGEDVNLYRDSYSPFWHETEEPIPSAAVYRNGAPSRNANIASPSTRSSQSGSPTSSQPIPISSPAASSKGWRSPAL